MRLIPSLVFVVAATTAASAFAVEGTFVDSSTVHHVQQTLTQRGFHRLPADGVMGPRTQAAIRDFQRSEHLQPTGQLNRQTLVALGMERPDARAAAEPSYNRTIVRKAQETLNARGFDAGPVNGNLTETMQSALRDFQKSENLEETGHLNDRTLAALGIDTASSGTPVAGDYRAPAVRDVQRELNRLGYDAGSEDGVFGHGTQTALMEFQHAQNLPVTGRIDRATIAALRKNGNVAVR